MQLRTLSDLILIVDHALPKEICERTIALYENNSKYQVRYDDPEHKPSFTQLVFTHNTHLDQALHAQLEMSLIQCTEIYRNQVLEAKYWPASPRYEGIRIKCYNNDGEDQFAEHVDAIDDASAKRFLIFLYYLNTVEEGGETEFTNLFIEGQPVKVKPQQGTVVMFPPMWMYPHKAYPPVTNKKYILSSNLTF